MRRGRRGNNEGSISHTADGRWVARISLPGGRRKSVYGKTREEAARALTEALASKQRNLPTAPGRLSVAQFAARWLTAVRPNLRPTTWITYERYLRLHVVPTVGRHQLPRLQAIDLQELYASLLTQGLSPSTVRHVHAVVHRMLHHAMRWDLVFRNVADLVDPPRVPRVEMAALNVAQVQRLLEAAADDRFEALYVLAVTTGLRKGELLALRWKDVDMERATLAVRGTLQREGGLTIAETKTARSRRRTDLGALAVAALRRRRALQAEERLLAGASWVEQGVVFSSAVGGLVEPGNLLRRSYEPLLARAGLPRIRFHDLRHTAATLMLGQGVHPKIASDILGHSTVAITLDLYSHVLPGMGRDTARVMDDLLAPRR